MTILNLLLTLPLLGGGEAPAPATLEKAAVVLRRYDLADVNRLLSTSESSRRLLPASLRSRSEAEWHPLVWSINPDLIIGAIQDYLDPELDAQGWMVWEDDQGQLLVRAPESTHAQISGLLDFFASVAGATTEFQIDVLELPLKAEMGVLPSGIVESAVADKLIGSLGSTYRNESYTLQVPATAAARLDMTTEHTFIGDYSVEVAEGVGIYDPKTISMTSGMRLDISAFPAPGGCHLALVVRHGSPTGPLKDVPLKCNGVMAAESDGRKIFGPQQRGSMSMSMRTYALNTALPDGKALVLRSTLDLSEGGGTQYLVLRKMGATPPAIHEITLGNENNKIHLVSTQALSVPVLQFGMPPNRDTFSSHELCESGLRGVHLESKLDPELQSTETGVEVLRDMMQMSKFRAVDRLAMITRFSHGPAQEECELEEQELIQLVDQLQSPIEMVSVSIQVTRGGAELSRDIQCEIPLRLGVESAIVTGIEGTRLYDYEVEIAAKAAVTEPVVGLDLEGLVLLVKVSRARSGGFDLQLRGMVKLQRKLSTFDPIIAGFGSIEQEASDFLELNDVVHVPATGNRSLVLGNTASGGDSKGIRFQIQVR